MNFCTKCGNPLKSDARFCGKCGEKLFSSGQAQPHLQEEILKCRSCCAGISPGIKFCMSCGTAVANPTLSPPEIKRPAVSPIPTKDLRNQDSVSKGPIKNKGRKFLKIAFSLVVIVSVSVAGLYFYGTYAPDSGSTDPRALDAAAKELDKSNAVKTDSAAQVVETVFAASDTTGLALILSPSSLKIRRPYFSKLLPYMPAYANDFKDRKLLYANDRYAVYEFATPKGRFTAEFCLGDNGKWMLMRF